MEKAFIAALQTLFQQPLIHPFHAACAALQIARNYDQSTQQQVPAALQNDDKASTAETKQQANKGPNNHSMPHRVPPTSTTKVARRPLFSFPPTSTLPPQEKDEHTNTQPPPTPGAQMAAATLVLFAQAPPSPEAPPPQKGSRKRKTTDDHNTPVSDETFLQSPHMQPSSQKRVCVSGEEEPDRSDPASTTPSLFSFESTPPTKPAYNGDSRKRKNTDDHDTPTSDKTLLQHPHAQPLSQPANQKRVCVSGEEEPDRPAQSPASTTPSLFSFESTPPTKPTHDGDSSQPLPQDFASRRMARPIESKLTGDEAELALRTFLEDLHKPLKRMLHAPHRLTLSERPDDRFLHQIDLPVLYELPSYKEYNGRILPKQLLASDMLFEDPSGNAILDIKKLRNRVLIRIEKASQRARSRAAMYTKPQLAAQAREITTMSPGTAPTGDEQQDKRSAEVANEEARA
jgi:hypothetical protein